MNIQPKTLEIVTRYLAVWSEPEPRARRAAIAELWAANGVEFVEGTRFTGHAELDARITEAHDAFVASGTFHVTAADDVTEHDDVTVFTIQLIHRQGAETGQVAWAARVFLVLDKHGLIREDYHLTVQPLAAA